MVLDSAKGVEAHALALMEVCRMRDTPVMTYCNKYDRESMDPFELLDTIEKQLGIQTAPMTWPIGMGKDFQGVLQSHQPGRGLLPGRHQGPRTTSSPSPDDPALEDWIGPDAAARLRTELELLEGASPPFDPVA